MQHGPLLQHVHSHSDKLWWEVWTGLNAHALSCRQSFTLVSVQPTPTTASFNHHCILKPVCLNSTENSPALLNLYYSIFEKCGSCRVCATPSPRSLSEHSWLAGWWGQLTTTLPHRDIWKQKWENFMWRGNENIFKLLIQVHKFVSQLSGCPLWKECW